MLEEYNCVRYLRKESLGSFLKYHQLRLPNMSHNKRKNLVKAKVMLKISKIVQIKLINKYINLKTNQKNTIIFYKCHYGT